MPTVVFVAILTAWFGLVEGGFDRDTEPASIVVATPTGVDRPLSDYSVDADLLIVPHVAMTERVAAVANLFGGAPTLEEIASEILQGRDSNLGIESQHSVYQLAELLSQRTGLPSNQPILIFGEDGKDPSLLANIAFTISHAVGGVDHKALTLFSEDSQRHVVGADKAAIYNILGSLEAIEGDRILSIEDVETLLYGDATIEGADRYSRDLIDRAATILGFQISGLSPDDTGDSSQGVIPPSFKGLALIATIVLSVWLLFSEGYLPGNLRSHKGDPYFYAGGSTGLNRAWRSIVAAFIRAISAFVAFIQGLLSLFGGSDASAERDTEDAAPSITAGDRPTMLQSLQSALSNFHIVAGLLVLIYGLAVVIFAPVGAVNRLATAASSPFWIICFAAILILLVWDLKSVFQKLSRFLERIGPGVFTLAFTIALLTLEALIAATSGPDVGIIETRPETGGWLTAIATSTVGLLIARAIYERLSLRLYYTSFRKVLGRVTFGVKSLALGLASFLIVRVIAEQARRFQGNDGQTVSEQFLTASFWCVVVLLALTAFCTIMALARGWERQIRQAREDSGIELTLPGRFVLALIPVALATGLFVSNQISHTVDAMATGNSNVDMIARASLSDDGVHLAVENSRGDISVKSAMGDAIRHTVATRSPYLTALVVGGVEAVPIVAYADDKGRVFTSKAGAIAPRPVPLNIEGATSADGLADQRPTLGPPVLAFGPNAELFAAAFVGDATVVHRPSGEMISISADFGPPVSAISTGPSSFAIAMLDGTVFSIVEGIEGPRPATASEHDDGSLSPVRALSFDHSTSTLFLRRQDGSVDAADVVDGMVGSFVPRRLISDEKDPVDNPDIRIDPETIEIALNSDDDSETRIFNMSASAIRSDTSRDARSTVATEQANVTRPDEIPVSTAATADFQPITDAIIYVSEDDRGRVDAFNSYFGDAGINSVIEVLSRSNLPGQNEISYALETQKQTAESYRRGLERAGVTDISLVQRSTRRSDDDTVIYVRLAPSAIEEELVEEEPVEPQKPAPDVSPGEIFRDRDREGSSFVGPDMVVLPAGSFIMGSRADEPGRYEDEGEARLVEITSPIAVSRFEVTWTDWSDCVSDGACRSIDPNVLGVSDGNSLARLPIVGVTWQDAVDYTEWLTNKTGSKFRLLTEAEWEYAARSGTTTTFWWGDEANRDAANFGKDICCGGATDGGDEWLGVSPVGSFAPNDFGLFDTHGNVSEWVVDCYAPFYGSEHPTNGQAFSGSGSCDSRVVRGGSWFHVPRMLRSAKRVGLSPDAVYDFIGFRVAMELS